MTRVCYVVPQVVASLYLAMVAVMVGLNYRLRGRQLQRHGKRTADKVDEDEEDEEEVEEKSLEVVEARQGQGLTVCFTEGRAGPVISSLVTNQREAANKGRGQAVVEL